MMMSSRCCHHVEVRPCRFQVRVWQCVLLRHTDYCFYSQFLNKLCSFFAVITGSGQKSKTWKMMLKFTEVLGIEVVDFHASAHCHKWLAAAQNSHVSWNHELTWQVGPYWWLGGSADSDTFDCKNDLSEMTNVGLVGR